jgi:phage-related protein
MPGSVLNAAPATVLPQSLCRTFVHERVYPLIENEYKNGESQRSVQATNSRRRWRLAKRLTPSALQTLRDFFDARNGSTEPFYFYDPYDTNPRFSYDPTGVVTVGRYTVRFNGDWQQSSGLGRSDVQIELLELA